MDNREGVRPAEGNLSGRGTYSLTGCQYPHAWDLVACTLHSRISVPHRGHAPVAGCRKQLEVHPPLAALVIEPALRLACQLELGMLDAIDAPDVGLSVAAAGIHVAGIVGPHIDDRNRRGNGRRRWGRGGDGGAGSELGRRVGTPVLHLDVVGLAQSRNPWTLVILLPTGCVMADAACADWVMTMSFSIEAEMLEAGLSCARELGGGEGSRFIAVSSVA